MRLRKVKVKVAQSCPTLCDPMYCNSPWDSPGQYTGVGSHSLLQWIFPTQGSNPRSPALQADSLPADPLGKPKDWGRQLNPLTRVLNRVQKVHALQEPFIHEFVYLLIVGEWQLEARHVLNTASVSSIILRTLCCISSSALQECDLVCKILLFKWASKFFCV